ncbi:efflux RND transporter periplasmic adaptor subunit [Brevibacillus ruminantium]|uniref:Efflux RND transporter periplasmic adaptor subunit n=1 Tax=Brevibacillus ruminantium TaxID=2950604 RepID=A0ABY4WIB2_9BACL|nr:efflux RND transporter periplasmic adaptor subunit [Brevibacillus ruminantium]USG66890.1 efflux RND transporter periplasmic adaptor subunit [Brevibacillus ruminantium]
MRSSNVKTTVIILTIFSVLAGCSPQQGPMGQRGGAGQRAIPVEVKQVSQETFGQKLSLSGRLEASNQVALTSKASGRIMQVHAKVGDQVKAGQPIVTLEGEEINIQLQRSEAALLSAQARYKEAKEGTPEETVAQTKNQLTDLQNKYDTAKKELERTTTLYQQGAISAAEYEKAKAALDSAAISLENQKEKLKLDQKGPTESSLATAQATLKQAEADLALSRLNASNLVVKAPIDGVIGSLQAAVGSNVGTNTEIAQIINLTKIKVKTQATESQVGLFRNGQEVEVKVPSVQLVTKGIVSSVSPLADASKSYPIEIEIDNPDLQLKAGMIASIEMTGKPHDALIIPREAIISREAQDYVYIVEDDRAKMVAVKRGESDGERVEILEGLSAGESVVIKGQNTLTDGSGVVVIDPNQPNSSDSIQNKDRQRGPGNQGNPGRGQGQGQGQGQWEGQGQGQGKGQGQRQKQGQGQGQPQGQGQGNSPASPENQEPAAAPKG